MTLKEWAKRNGASIEDRYIGGAFGCPIDYSFVKNNKEYICENLDPNGEKCTKCWNQEYKEARMANADRIRSMTDEKLAAVLRCPVGGIEELCEDVESYEGCVKCTLEWLQKG